MRKNTPPWYALSGWRKKQNKQNIQVYFSYFEASLLNTDKLPKLWVSQKNPFFPQYIDHAMGQSPLWAVYWEGTEGTKLSHWACRPTVEPTMATTAVAQHGYWALPLLGSERQGEAFDWWSYKTADPSHQLHCTKGNTKPRAGLPNPASVQHCSYSDPPPSLSYKYTYLKKWFLFADAKSRIFQHNSVDHDDIREF